MIRKLAVGCALLGCVWAGAGCETRVATLKPAGTAAVKLQAEQKTTTFRLRPLHLLTLTLPPAPASHRWTIALHDTRYLKLVADIQPAASPEEGASVSFLALRPGRTRLRFVLLPATARRMVQPLDHHELVLIIE